MLVSLRIPYDPAVGYGNWFWGMTPSCIRAKVPDELRSSSCEPGHEVAAVKRKPPNPGGGFGAWRVMARCAVLVLAVCLLGTDSATGQMIACTLELRPGIVLEVRDGGTGAAAAHGARAEVTDGLYSAPLEIVEWESLDPASAYLMEGAYERPGEARVTWRP
jgi:hypothetical protein